MVLHECEDCSYRTANAETFARHRNKHSGVRPYACTYPDCPYAAAHQSTVCRHVKEVHRGIKRTRKRLPCSWEGCDYATPKRPALRKHEARHTGPRPHICGRRGCWKAKFSTIEKLQSHRRLHEDSDVQAQKAASAASQDAPDAMEEIISGDAIQETLTCKHASCDYTTHRKRKLELHEARHTPETPFVCSQHKCRFSCRKIKHLKRHVKSAHGENGPTQEAEPVGSDGRNAAGTLPSARVKEVEPKDDDVPIDVTEGGLGDAVNATPEEQGDSEDDGKQVNTRTRIQSRRYRIPSSSVYEPSSDADDDAEFVDEDISQVDDDASYVDENTSGVEGSEPLPKRRRLRRSTGSSVSTSSLQTSHRESSRAAEPSSSRTFRRVEVSIPPAPEHIRRFRSQSVALLRPATTSQATTPRRPSQASASSQSTPTPFREPVHSPERRSKSVTPLFLPEDEKPPSPEPKRKKRKRNEDEDAQHPPTKAEVRAMIQEGVRPLAEEINSLAEMIQLLVEPR